MKKKKKEHWSISWDCVGHPGSWDLEMDLELANSIHSASMRSAFSPQSPLLEEKILHMKANCIFETDISVTTNPHLFFLSLETSISSLNKAPILHLRFVWGTDFTPHPSLPSTPTPEILNGWFCLPGDSWQKYLEAFWPPGWGGNVGGLLTSVGWRPRMLPNTLQCIGQPPRKSDPQLAVPHSKKPPEHLSFMKITAALLTGSPDSSTVPWLHRRGLKNF